MNSTLQSSDLFRRSTWLLSISSLWLVVSAILISHFRFYYHADWQNAIKWGLGDGFLWTLLIGLFLLGFRRHCYLFKSLHGVIAVFGLSVACGVILHPTVSTLFFWAIDGSISRPFHEDVLHLVMKRLPQGILAGVALGFAGVIIANLNSTKGRRTTPPTIETTRPLSPQWVTLKDPRGMHRIPFDDIFYLEAAGNYVALHTSSGERLNRITLKALEETLDAEKFFRISRKHIVNLDSVRSVQLTKPKSNIVTLVNNVALPLSQRYKKVLQDALANTSGVATNLTDKNIKGD